MYLVTFNGINKKEEPGAHIYVLGLYEKREYAENAINNVKNKYSDDSSILERFIITEIEVNRTLSIVRDISLTNYYETDTYLGGYVED